MLNNVNCFGYVLSQAGYIQEERFVDTSEVPRILTPEYSIDNLTQGSILTYYSHREEEFIHAAILRDSSEMIFEHRFCNGANVEQVDFRTLSFMGLEAVSRYFSSKKC